MSPHSRSEYFDAEKLFRHVGILDIKNVDISVIFCVGEMLVKLNTDNLENLVFKKIGGSETALSNYTQTVSDNLVLCVLGCYSYQLSEDSVTKSKLPHMVRIHQDGYPYLNLSKKIYFFFISRDFYLFGKIGLSINSQSGDY